MGIRGRKAGVEWAGTGGRGGGERERGREVLQISQRSETCTKILMRNLPTRNYFACFVIHYMFFSAMSCT